MSVLRLTQFGSPILRTPARPLSQADIASRDIQTLIADMVDTMIKERGVGIAAPQVGRDLQLAILEFPNPRDPDRPERIAIINPSITERSNEEEDDWEGCLSLPGVRGIVPRSREIELSYLDPHGNRQVRLLNGFSARVAQHEVDHLNGILFVDRMRDMTTLSTEREMSRQLEAERKRRRKSDPEV